MRIRKHRTIIISALTILAIVVGTPLACMAEKPLIFGSVAKSHPLSFEENGVVKGFLPEVFHEIARRAGFEIGLKSYPVKRLEQYLRTGQIDGFVFLVSTENRKAYLTYAKSPIITSRTLVFVKKGREFSFNTVNDLFGKKIGIVLGWRLTNDALEKAIQEGRIRVDNAPGHDHNLKKLMTERVDCVIGTEQTTYHYANKLGISDKIATLETPISTISAFFGISKNTENITSPQGFMKAMNDALNGMVSDGTYEKIMKQHKLSFSD